MQIRRFIGWGVIVLVALAVVAAFAVYSMGGRTTETKVSAAQHSPIPTGKTCADCHAKDKTHLPPYVGACDKCHGLSSWRIVIYQHKSTDLDMGIHGVMGCSRCHTEGSPVVPTTCTSCHPVKHAGWTDCRKCHFPLNWRDRKPTPQGHLSLAGGHSKLSCLDCHAQPNAPATPRTCTNCHGTKHGGLTNCATCHDPANGWKPGSFNHNVFFRITGRHTRLTCTQCHPRGRFAGTPAACVGCHGRKHGGLTNCAKCHTTARFVPSTFRHSTVFPLSPGPHARLACTRCHPNRLYARVNGRTCVGCHGRVHGMTTCTPCHTRTGAVASNWNHGIFFPLVGAHTSLACSACHGTPFRPAPGKNCVDCHGVKHGNQTQCANCHTTTAFVPIHAITHPNGIRIGGHHGSLSGCAECHHTPLNFGTAPRTCTNCHGTKHGGLTDCLRCHSPVASWLDLHFTHPGIEPHTPAEFPCDSCHANGDFTLPRSLICVYCHGSQ